MAASGTAYVRYLFYINRARSATTNCATGRRGISLFTKFGDLKWEKTNPEQGSNSPEVAILYQSPKETELFIRSPKNYHVPRHWHSANETITVLRGTFILKHDGSEERMVIEPGSFAWMPAKMIHEAWTKPDDGALYFVTTDGPFDIHWVDPATAKVGQ